MASGDHNKARASSGGDHCGRLRWGVDKESISSRNTYSDSIEVGGMPWKICVHKNEGVVFDHLSLYIARIDGDYKVRSVTATIECMLINHSDETMTVVKKHTITFDEHDHAWGYKQFVRWSSAIDEDKGFIRDGKLTLQVDFTLSKVVGFRHLPRKDFTDSKEPSHDVALVINAEKIYVSKSHLAIHSPVFHKMFYGECAEKEQEEVEVTDVKREEFIEMLKVIYPPSKKITDENYSYLLKLGNRFEIDLIVDHCEQFIIASTSLTIADKLVLAGTYRLAKLQDHCLDKLKKIKDVTNLKKSDESKNFTDDIKVALYEKILQISD